MTSILDMLAKPGNDIPRDWPARSLRMIMIDGARIMVEDRILQRSWLIPRADLAFRALEVAGEAGELAEAIKKFLRAERGIKGTTATREDVAAEMGDLLVSLDLLANQMGIDLGEAVRAKFNRTSEKYGMRTYIGTDGDWHLRPDAA